MKISIITASYNYADIIGETVKSVINQTYTDWELIIVDDASTDNSTEIIQTYCDKDCRIKLYVNDINMGLKGTLLRGITLANGDWIQFLESDDLLVPNALEEKIKIINKYPEIAIVFSNLDLFGEEKNFNNFEKYLNLQQELLRKYSFPAVLQKEFLYHNIIPTFSTVMCRKERLLECNFDTAIDAYLDWHLWAQISKYPIYFLDVSLTKWRIHSNSYINQVGKKDDLRHLRFETDIYKFTSSNASFTIFFFKIFKYLKWFRRKIIRISAKDKSITLFGKKFSY